MDLNYIEEKLKGIHRNRFQILKEMNLEGFSYNDSNVLIASKKFNRKFSSLKDMRLACIMDEFTFQSFNPECNVLQITPQNWHQELERFKPDLFFLESAWRGINDLWNMKIAYLSDDLIDIFGYCRKNDIPVVFWNKEDPVHFNTFIDTSKYADFVFTTDIDCIKNYKTILNHERVYLMPFAAQTKYHNPVEIYERKDKFCFAGAYYKRFQDRKRDLETFVDVITSIKEMDIYDRNYNNKQPEYAFPRQYKRYIKGNLKSGEIDKAYKGYLFNINMNSVKQSQSMCARRIFELLACNTVTVSNYSRAIRNLFGDLVICTDDRKRLSDEILKFNDKEYYAKLRLSGLRKVLSEHTYRERLMYIVNKVFDSPLNDGTKNVAVIAKANSTTEIDHVICQFKRQIYKNKQLFIVTDVPYDNAADLDNIQYVDNCTEEVIANIQNNYDYTAFFSASDYYGKNYLYDLVLTTKYTELPVISKSSYFSQCNGSIVRIVDGPSYKPFNRARIRMAIIQVNHFNREELIQYVNSINEGIISETCMSIDEYNYCMNYSEDDCETVDDLVITDTGFSMHTMHGIVDQIKPNNTNVNNLDNKFETGCSLSKSNILLIADNYPDYQDLYRYAFIHSRLIGYKNSGLVVDVFKYSERHPKGYSEFEGIDIACGYYEELNNTLFYGNYDTILIHFLTDTIWNGIEHTVKGKKIIVWIHGAEIQPWWRRKHNYSTREQLEHVKIESNKRLEFWRNIFNIALQNSEYNFHFVFVSEYLAKVVFEDLKVTLPEEKYSIIHNYINNRLFTYNKKDKDMRKKILSVRPFANHNYANDLTVKAIKELAKDPIFKELEFRIVGKGELFKTTLKPIKKYKNVILEEKFLRQEEIAELHKEYGVFLVPTRMDTQGVSRDEAMSSGLVPITNKVAAVPEFVDDNCGMLVPEEDYKELATSIRSLYYDSDLFQRLSCNAAERVRKLSGLEYSIIKEINLISNHCNISHEE